MNLKNYTPAIRLAILSLLICGLFFPVLVTGIGQLLFPYQANGSILQLNGQGIGSYLVAQTFTLPRFFHQRPSNLSASGVDPDITVQDAYSQIPRIATATGISPDTLKTLVDAHTERTFWLFGDPYVNVLNLNLLLITQYGVKPP